MQIPIDVILFSLTASNCVFLHAINTPNRKAGELIKYDAEKFNIFAIKIYAIISVPHTAQIYSFFFPPPQF